MRCTGLGLRSQTVLKRASIRRICTEISGMNRVLPADSEDGACLRGRDLLWWFISCSRLYVSTWVRSREFFKKIMFIRFNEIFFRLQFFCACLYLSAHAQNSRRRQIQSL